MSVSATICAARLEAIANRQRMRSLLQRMEWPSSKMRRVSERSVPVEPCSWRSSPMPHLESKPCTNCPLRQQQRSCATRHPRLSWFPDFRHRTRVSLQAGYVRFFYQIRNMMEFVEMVIQRKSPEDQVNVHLVTGPDDGNFGKQRELLDSISDA